MNGADSGGGDGGGGDGGGGDGNDKEVDRTLIRCIHGDTACNLIEEAVLSSCESGAAVVSECKGEVGSKCIDSHDACKAPTFCKDWKDDILKYAGYDGAPLPKDHESAREVLSANVDEQYWNDAITVLQMIDPTVKEDELTIKQMCSKTFHDLDDMGDPPPNDKRALRKALQVSQN